MGPYCYTAQPYTERGELTHTSHMYPHIHATCAYIHVYTHIHNIYTYPHMYTHSHTLIHTHALTQHTQHTHILPHTHTHLLKQNTHTHTHSNHTQTLTHTHTITHCTQLHIITHTVIYRERNKVRITHTERNTHEEREGTYTWLWESSVVASVAQRRRK